MRRIKFRGKDLKTGEWVYGDLHVLCDAPHIHTSPSVFPYAGKRSFIDPETIGQFTGILDHNGKEIYEGDVIADCRANDIRHEIFYCEEEGRFKAAINGKRDSFFGCCGLDDTRWNRSKVVIGNVHDSKDLFKNSRKF